jgi:hypothetical protein
MSHAAGKDPLQFQIELLGKDELLPGKGVGFNTGRSRAVLEKISELSGWGKRSLPPRTGVGVVTHLFLNKDAPVPPAIEAVGDILCHPILGGLHHQYVRI